MERAEIEYWQMITEMRPGLVENSAQIAFRTGCRYGRPSVPTDNFNQLISQGIGDGLITSYERDVLGSGIMVTNYFLTPEGVAMHKKLRSLEEDGIEGIGLEKLILPDPGNDPLSSNDPKAQSINVTTS